MKYLKEIFCTNYGEKKNSEKYSLIAGVALGIFAIAPEIITAVIVREKSPLWSLALRLRNKRSTLPVSPVSFFLTSPMFLQF